MNSNTLEHTMEKMTRHEELVNIFWDMYKDAHGFRPRHMWEALQTMTEAEIIQDLDRLEIIIRDNEQQRQLAEHEAAHAFEMRILSLLASGAKDREMAMRWIHEAEGSNGDDEFLCYLVGLPYQYFRKVA
jgi:hypothetical protein